MKFVPRGQINSIPSMVQIMAWRRSGDKPLSEPVMVSLLTYMRHLASMEKQEAVSLVNKFNMFMNMDQKIVHVPSRYYVPSW